MVIVSPLLIFFIFVFQGCYDAVRDKVLSNLQIVIGVSVGVLALQILGIIFAFCLCKAIGNDRDYHYKYWHRGAAASEAAIVRQQQHPSQEQLQSEKRTFLQNLNWKMQWIITFRVSKKLLCCAKKQERREKRHFHWGRHPLSVCAWMDDLNKLCLCFLMTKKSSNKLNREFINKKKTTSIITFWWIRPLFPSSLSSSFFPPIIVAIPIYKVHSFRIPLLLKKVVQLSLAVRRFHFSLVKF